MQRIGQDKMLPPLATSVRLCGSSNPIALLGNNKYPPTTAAIVVVATNSNSRSRLIGGVRLAAQDRPLDAAISADKYVAFMGGSEQSALRLPDQRQGEAELPQSFETVSGFG
jgi:hypothetical protein